jgi:DNA mismatch repair protein MutS
MKQINKNTRRAKIYKRYLIVSIIIGSIMVFVTGKEYIEKNIKCKTLFSTHYHELTDLENKLDNLKNIHVSAVEDNGNITFLHKIKNGSIDKSYGIHVAQMAGLPKSVIDKSQELMKKMQKDVSKILSTNKSHKSDGSSEPQLTLF